MVDVGYYFYIVSLENGDISYETFCKEVPLHEIPKEYQTYALFLKNRGKASKRLEKESEWSRLKWLKEWNILD